VQKDVTNRISFLIIRWAYLRAMDKVYLTTQLLQSLYFVRVPDIRDDVVTLTKKEEFFHDRLNPAVGVEKTSRFTQLNQQGAELFLTAIKFIPTYPESVCCSAFEFPGERPRGKPRVY